MKTWFTYLINGKKIGIRANNNMEAERNLRKEFGGVPIKSVGMEFGELGTHPDKVITDGMSATDMIIETGTFNVLVGLRYWR